MQSWAGMMNIGKRPTFGDVTEPVMEVHLCAFEGDLYGATLRVEFVARLRDERKFNTVEALVKQLQEDKKRCMEALAVVSSTR